MQWWIDLLAPFAAGLVFAGAGAAAARILADPPPGRDWTRIRPGGLHWSAVILGSGLVGLMLYVRLFVGSDRADAEAQMQILVLLLLAFALCTALCLRQMRAIVRADIRWRGRRLEHAGVDGNRIARDLGDVVGMRRRWTGEIEIAFTDGHVMRLDSQAAGVPQLCERIIRLDGELAAGLPL